MAGSRETERRAMDTLSWDVVKAAGLHSQLSGVLAGVAFVAMTLVLTRDVSRDRAKGHWLPRVMIGELFAAFLALAVASLTWGIIAGEASSDSVRPYAAGAFATIILTIGSVQMVAGLCYLVLDFDSKPDEGHDPAVKPVSDNDHKSTDGGLIASCRTGYSLVAGFAIFNIVFTFEDVLLRGFYAPQYSQHLGWYILPIAAGSITLVALRSRKMQVAALKRPFDPSKQGRGRRALNVLVVLAVVGFMLVITTPATGGFVRRGEWGLSSEVIAYIAAVSLLAILSAVFFVAEGLLMDQRTDALKADVRDLNARAVASPDPLGGRTNDSGVQPDGASGRSGAFDSTVSPR
jgi:hypothetical protein